MTTDRASDGAGAPPRPSGRSSRPPRSRTTGASSSTSSSEALTVGRAGRPHGLDGSFYVAEATPELPAGDGFLLVHGERRRIVRRAGDGGRPVLPPPGGAPPRD